MRIQNLIGDKKTRFSWSVKQFEYEIVNQIFGVKEFVDSCASSSSYFSFFNFFLLFKKQIISPSTKGISKVKTPAVRAFKATYQGRYTLRDWEGEPLSMTAMETVTDLLLEIMEVTYRFTPCLRIEPCYNLTRQWLEVCWSFFVNVRVMWKKICHAIFRVVLDSIRILPYLNII